MISFNDYQNKSILESNRKLKILHKVLKLFNMKNKLVSDGKDSFIFIKSNSDDIKGIRIYPIANKIAFRIQNDLKEFPQGRPYLLDFEKIFGEIVNDQERRGKKDKEVLAAQKVAEQLIKTLKDFFFEKANNLKDKQQLATGITLGTDYSSLIYSKY